MPLLDSPFEVTTDDAVATVWLHRATLSPTAVEQLSQTLHQVANRPATEIVVLRSPHSVGFPTADFTALRDLVSDEYAAEYARRGQIALRRLVECPVPTVAFLEGPCLGPGFELALACDYRLAVATPDAKWGFGAAPTAWGGLARLANRIGTRAARQFTVCYPREAAQRGLVDDAFCVRRAKIELRSFLDRLQLRPVKREVPTNVIAEAEERRAFCTAVRKGLSLPDEPTFELVNPVPNRPRRVGVLGSGTIAKRWVREFAIRGVPVTWVPVAVSSTCDFQQEIQSGRITPLEAEQAANRVWTTPEPDSALTADLVCLDETDRTGAAYLERVMPSRSILLLPLPELAEVLVTCDRPGRVLGWDSGNLFRHSDATDDALATARHWLQSVGETVTIREADPVATHSEFAHKDTLQTMVVLPR